MENYVGKWIIIRDTVYKVIQIKYKDTEVKIPRKERTNKNTKYKTIKVADVMVIKSIQNIVMDVNLVNHIPLDCWDIRDIEELHLKFLSYNSQFLKLSELNNNK